MAKNKTRFFIYVFLLFVSLILYTCVGAENDPNISLEETVNDEPYVDLEETVNDEPNESINILTTHAPYDFVNKHIYEIDGRSIIFENAPKNSAEEAVAMYFLFTITGEIDKLNQIVADTEYHRISIRNEKSSFEEGLSMQAYIIHDFTILTEKQYTINILPNDDYNDFFYSRWEEIVSEYGLIEYEIVNVEFTMYHSPKILSMGPQWWDGRFLRNFIVGKSPEDTSSLIYDFGGMWEVRGS